MLKNILTKPVLLFWMVIAFGVSSVVGGVYLISHGALGELPSPSSLDNPVFSEASIVFTSDSLNIGTYYKENRSNVKYDELPVHLVDALIATEDVRFNEHSGIDARGLARAIAYMGSKGGASTITQQLAKMLFHERPQSSADRLLQKVKEWIIAVQLEKRYTKKEIVALYFNQLDFVNQAVGIQSAALVYFNRAPKALSLTESAMLVGMAKNPSLFNPVRRPDTTLHRRNVVMHQMMRYGFLTKVAYDSLKVLPLGLHYQKVDHKIGVAPYFRQILRKELKRILNKRDESTDEFVIKREDRNAYNLYSDGLRIYTSIDSRLQRYAENAMVDHIKSLQKEFTNDISRSPNAPFNAKITSAQVKSAMKRAMKRSSRYMVLAGKLCGGCGRGALSMETVEVDGATVFRCEVCEHEQPEIGMDSIERIFNTKVDMELFAWEKTLDTSMTPLDSLRYYKGLLHAGLVSVDPRSGFVKAWVGGIDKKYFSYDHVSQGKRQVGSTFKPILYAFAVQQGVHPCEENPNLPYTIEKGKWGQLVDWTPKYGPKFDGMVSYKFALANSMNNVTAHLMGQLSPRGLIQFAREIGIESPLDPVASLCLGVADISLMEMVGAYATFANEGVWEKPQIIVRIDDKFGNTIYQPETVSREVMSSEHAYIMLDMMKGMADGVENDDHGKPNGTGRRRLRNIYQLTAPIAGKTGTTQNSADGWFMGITPDLVTGVWVGAEDRRVSFKSGALGQGAHMALPIWALYMKGAYADKTLKISIDDFVPPNDAIQASINCDGYSSSSDGGGFDD
ncbi:MAG: transglycosylase domain-containing protein [Flavobacteriales bacterium]|nr:transglycosylase domain-containing protein [Flavobacteriales bacterium]